MLPRGPVRRGHGRGDVATLPGRVGGRDRGSGPASFAVAATAKSTAQSSRGPRSTAAPAARPAPPHVAPRSPLERQLAAIWADLLHRERVGIHDHFFDLGGDSLLAVQTMLRPTQPSACDLPAAALFAAPTIAELADRIEAERRGEIEAGAEETTLIDDLAAGLLQPPASGGRSLVPLRTDGAATPLFCFHGLGGHVAGFLPLAEGLAEARPVYGLQAQGLGADEQPHDRIEAMADVLSAGDSASAAARAVLAGRLVDGRPHRPGGGRADSRRPAKRWPWWPCWTAISPTKTSPPRT